MFLRYIKPFLVFLFISYAHAQTMRLSSLGVNDGLSQSMVTSMYQDSRGFMWIGTGSGLNKFDGTKFTIYKHHAHSPYSISNNTIRKIMEDRWGNLWIGTERGLNKFDRTTNRFYPITPYANGDVKPLFIEQDSILYFFFTGHGFGSYNIPGNKLTLYYNRLTPFYSNMAVINAIPQKKKGRYWIITNLGIYHLQINGLTLSCTRDSVLNAFLPDHYVNSLIQVKNCLWVATNKGTIKFHTGRAQYESYKEIRFLHLDNNKVLWGFDQNGTLYKYERSTKEFIKASFDNFTNYPRNVKSLYSDRHNNLWIGTDGYDLFIYSTSANKFRLYNQSTLFADTPLSSNFTKSFSQDESGKTWVGTFHDGINIIDFTNRTNSRLLPQYTVHTLCRSKGTMWAGTQNGLYRFDTRSLAKTSVPLYKDSICVFNVKQLTDGRMLAGTSKGLFISSNDLLSFTKLFDHKLPIKCTYEDLNHIIWFADAHRIYFSQPPYADYKQIVLKQGDELFDCSAKCFMEDTIGNLWIASNNGLIAYNSKKQAQSFLTELNGLPDLMVYGILPDQNKRFWLSTNKGISCFDPYKKTFRNYDVTDGLQSDEFNSGAFYKAPSGLMYFGGINGFNVFDPLSITENKKQTKINLVGLKVSDEDLSTETDYSELKQLTLTHSENTVSFEFAAMNYGNPKKNRYAYMLEGVDDDWVESGVRGFARYANIRPGDYLFKVKAAKENGTWSAGQSLLYLTITPPWWKTWWAVASWLLITIAIVFFSIRVFINRKLEEQLRELEKLQAVNRERTRISKDMHDDLGSGLSRIAIMSELLKQQLQEVNNEQVEKISRTAGDLIDSMSHIIWAMNPDNDRISNLVAYVREHAAEFLESCGLNYELHFPESTPEIALTQESRRNIFLVIKESLNNIVKHACARNVQINIDIKGSKLRIMIKDDGKGFEIGKTRKDGNGLRNMQKRMEQVHGTFQIYSIIGKGTTTTLSLPAKI